MGVASFLHWGWFLLREWRKGMGMGRGGQGPSTPLRCAQGDMWVGGKEGRAAREPPLRREGPSGCAAGVGGGKRAGLKPAPTGKNVVRGWDTSGQPRFRQGGERGKRGDANEWGIPISIFPRQGGRGRGTTPQPPLILLSQPCPRTSGEGEEGGKYEPLGVCRGVHVVHWVLGEVRPGPCCACRTAPPPSMRTAPTPRAMRAKVVKLTSPVSGGSA